MNFENLSVLIQLIGILTQSISPKIRFNYIDISLFLTLSHSFSIIRTAVRDFGYLWNGQVQLLEDVVIIGNQIRIVHVISSFEQQYQFSASSI